MDRFVFGGTSVNEEITSCSEKSWTKDTILYGRMHALTSCWRMQRKGFFTFKAFQDGSAKSVLFFLESLKTDNVLVNLDVVNPFIPEAVLIDE